MKFDFPPEYRLVPAEFIAARVAGLAQACREAGAAALLLTAATDVYYASGSMQQGAVLVTADGEAVFHARRHPGRAAAESGLPVEPISGLSQVAQAVERVAPAGARVGLCLDLMSAREYLGWRGRLPGLELTDLTKAVLAVKGVKDAFEIEAVKRCGALAAEVYAMLPQWIRPGVSEAAVAAEMLAMAVRRGHMDLLRTRGAYMETYSWHLVSGPEGSTPSAIDAPFGGIGFSPAFPQGASLKPLRPHEPILVDFGVCLEGYQTDQTRTYCLGEAPGQVRRAHAALEAVEAALLDALRPGAVSGELFDLAVGVAEAHGMGDVFLGRPEQRIKFVGHGLGLELGAPPYLLKGSPARVRAHEVYALELKIVLDVGPVGLENTVIVNPDGPPTLVCPLPSRLLELPL
ncbi:MAG: M24 family metallopeptidase [Thermodesulfobacteriota bacterium]